jgi:RNA polymerase sigma factor (TIGR02999 family)
VSEELTDLLARVSAGDEAANNRVFELLYSDLRARAHAELGRLVSNTLSTTCLVHETYLKLVDKRLAVHDRSHFFRLASHVMRQVLIDHERARSRVKRGGGLAITSLDDADAEGPDQFPLMALDRALNQLQSYDGKLAELTELHVFGGLGFQEIADMLDSSERSIYRDWRMARVFLRKAMAETPP